MENKAGCWYVIRCIKINGWYSVRMGFIYVQNNVISDIFRKFAFRITYILWT